MSSSRFQELSRALYSLTVLATTPGMAFISIPAGKVNDISGNQNLASNQLQVNHCKNNLLYHFFASNAYCSWLLLNHSIHTSTQHRLINENDYHIHMLFLNLILNMEKDSTPAISMALHSFVTVGVLATSLAAAALSLSSANLGSIGTLASGNTNNVASSPSMNLHVSI